MTDEEALIVITFLEARFPKPEHRDAGKGDWYEIGTCWKSIYDEYDECEECQAFIFTYKVCQELRKNMAVLAE